MTDYKIKNNDISFDRIEGEEVLQQRLKNRLALWLGEFRLTPNSGVNWLSLLERKVFYNSRVRSVIKTKLLEDNQKILSEIRDKLTNLAPVSQEDTQMIDALRSYINSEDKGDILAMFVRLVDSKANLHKLLLSQGKIREAENVHSEWKALVEVANLLGIESELEMIKKE